MKEIDLVYEEADAQPDCEVCQGKGYVKDELQNMYICDICKGTGYR